MDVYLDYFVAKKTPGIKIWKIGPHSLNPDVTFKLIKAHHVQPFSLNFASKIETMWTFAAVGNLPNVLGVRVALDYQRRADGKQFHAVTAYGVGYQALGIYTMDRRDIGLPPWLKEHSLMLNEIMPFLSTTENWTEPVFNENTKQLEPE